VSSELALRSTCAARRGEHATRHNRTREWGIHPGGGGTERLPHLVPARSGARNSFLGANDFRRRTPRTETIRIRQPGHSDAERDGFVDALARRIAHSTGRAIAARRSLVNQSVDIRRPHSSPPFTFGDRADVAWKVERIQTMLERGLHGIATSRLGGPRCSAAPRQESLSGNRQARRAGN